MNREFLVTDPVGLHARPATLLVNEASKYACECFINYNDKKVNLKSIMGVMSLGITTNSKFTVECDGPDVEEAINGISNVLVESNVASIVK